MSFLKDPGAPGTVPAGDRLACSWLHTAGVLADLKYSVRGFARSPGLTVALLFTIAVGIGSNAAVLGFVRGTVGRDLPIPDIDRMFSLFARDEQDALGPVSYDGYQLLQAQLGAVARLGAARESQSLVQVRERSQVMSIATITPELADLLQIPANDGVVISHRLWSSEFAAAAGVRGEPLRIDGIDTQVADVAPEGLDGLYIGRAVDIWMPAREPMTNGFDRSSRTFWAIGRLGPNGSIDQVQAIVNSTRSGADAIAVLSYTGLTPEATGGMARITRLLYGAAGVVFFIACVNVATFLLARASARSHETSVRVALGAGRGQLTKGLLSDSVLISVVGGMLGGLLAIWTIDIVPALLFDQDAEELAFVPDVIGTLAVCIVCVLLTIACGLLPLLDLRHDNPAAVLQRETAGPSRGMRRLRAGLVVAQMACCSVLVIGAGLLLKGFRSALQTSVGQSLGQPILATAEAKFGFDRPDLGLRYFDDLEQAGQSLPGVSSTTWVSTLPGVRPAWQSMRIEPPQTPRRDVTIDAVLFTPLAGRMFGATDTAQSCRVVVLNEEASREFFDGNPIGRTIEDPIGQRLEVVGVVADVKPAQSAEPGRPKMFLYAEQERTLAESPGPTPLRVPDGAVPGSAMFDVNVVSPSYFDRMGLVPIAGRTFRDAASLSCRVGVINQEAAERYFGRNAVGGAVIDGSGRRTEIIGVVHSALHGTSQRRPEPTIYMPMAQDFRPRMTLILNARETTDATLAMARRQFDAVPGGRMPVTVRTLAEHLSRTALASERIATVLVGASATSALLLGGLGLYGAMAEATRQRRREIAMRIALGAQGRRIIGLVLADGLRFAGAGTVAGMLGSLMLVRWLARITPTGGPPALWAWLAAPLALLVAVSIAAVLPARRAMTVDPLTILREKR
jgi:putative ABC transport system permease protein